MSLDIALKPYPCCHFTHAFADAAAAVLKELGCDHLDPADIVAIECPTTAALLPMVTEPAANKIAPHTIYDALFSVQYVVATALCGHPVDLGAFYDRPLDDPQILALAALITCPADPDSDFPTHFPGEVVVHLTDGRSVRRRVPASHGTPENPMTDTEVHAKFRGNAARVIDSDQAQHIAERVDTLENLPAISTLLQACMIHGPFPDPIPS